MKIGNISGAVCFGIAGSIIGIASTPTQAQQSPLRIWIMPNGTDSVTNIFCWKDE